MSDIADNKWTCERCGRTVTVHGSLAAIRCCLRAEQQRHAVAHREADLMKARLRKTDIDNPAKQYGV